MARQNIDDIFWLEIMAVAPPKSVDIDKLAGNAQRFFRYATEKYKLGKCVSEEEFKALGFLEELIPMFAKRTPEGIKAGGESRYFGWLDQKALAGQAGGKASSARKRDKKGRLLPKRHPSDIQANVQAESSESKHIQASSSSSSSSSSSNKNTNTAAKPRRKLEVVEFKTSKEMWGCMDSETITTWLKLYPDEAYRNRELIKAWDYYRTNERKRPTTIGGWKRAIGSWFERGWARHVAGIPGKGKDTKRPIIYSDAKEVLAAQDARQAEISKLTEEERAQKMAEIRAHLNKVKGAS